MGFETTSQSSTAPAQTRGIARPPAATTPPTFTTVTTPPVTTASVTTPTTMATPTTATPTTGTPATQVARPEEPAGGGLSTEGGTSFIPQLAPSSTPATTAPQATNAITEELEGGPTTGWFAGATVTDGGLVSSSATPTSVQPLTTAPVVTTTEVPATTTAPVPTTAAPTAAVPESSDSGRDLSRSRMSGLLEVAAVIGGVIALSAVPVMLARLIRTRREDEMLVAE